MSHPHWCDPQTCTIADPAQLYSVARRHASKEITVGHQEHPIHLLLVQEAGRLPTVVVSTAWTRSTAELDVQSTQQLHEATAVLLDLLADPQGSDA